MLEERKINYTSILSLACYASLAIVFLPIVDYFSPWYVTVLPFFAIIYITLYRNSIVMPLISTGITVVLLGLLCYWVIYRESSFSNYIINFVIAFLPCVTALQIRRTVDKKSFFEAYLTVATIFMGITSVTTIIGLNLFPMASRELASGTAVHDTEKYTRINMGGYEYIYALVIFIPILFWLIKNSQKWKKALYITVLVLNLLCIYESQYTIALLCAIGILFVIWMQSHKKWAIVVLIAVLLVLAVGGLSVLGEFFEWLSGIVNQEYASDRLMQLSQLFAGESIHTETDTERLELYMNELSAFGRSPIWGHNLVDYNVEEISGHTFIFDTLAGAGLLGLVLVAFLVRILYAKAIGPVRKKTPGCIVSVWFAVIVVACLNPIIFPIISTIAFMCCMCIQKIDT